MSNMRLRSQPVIARLAAALPGTFVGSAYALDYLQKYPTTFPAVWFGGQRLSPKSQSQGYSGQYRQGMFADIIARVVVKRVIQGSNDAEERMAVLCDQVSASILGWKMPGADTTFVFNSVNDGPPAEAILAVDLVFRTEVTYVGVPS